MEPNVFNISPVISKGFSLSMMLFCIFWFGIILLFIGIFISANKIQYTVTDDGLMIKNAIFYGRTISKDKIILKGIQKVNLKEEREFAPTLRTNGIGLPGFLSGWFRLKNKQKALLFVTDREKVLYIPTNQKYALLISVADPDAMLTKLKQIWQL
jgi:hypothetical protein